MGKLQTRLGGERDEAIFGLGRQAAQQVVEQRAPPNSASPRGAIVLPFLVALATLAGIPSVSAHTWVESPRDLCIQAIQSAIIDRTRDLFEDIYLPDRHQRPNVLYQLAEYGNFGDTFIDKGEEMFLARLGLEPATECSATKVPGTMMPACDQEETQSLLRANATVMFQGGGNWGDIWPQHQKLRLRDVHKFSKLPGMNIITMPNSLKFNDQRHRERDMKIVKRIVDGKHPTTRITFLFRQRNSYEEAKIMYPGIDVRLVPDIAFMLGPLIRVGSEKFKYDILFLARRDKEGGQDAERRVQEIHDEMGRLARHLTYFVGDWQDNPTDNELFFKHHVEERNVPTLRHSVIVDAGVRYFSTAKVIVCDRLHASILALLMDVPHVIVDGGPGTSSYGKRVMTRNAAFEASEHCTPSSLRFRGADTLIEGIPEGLALLDEFFGE